ncbi:lamin tail domain-containing protein, partial [bacterium]|nr:lamin tail domain-containing protein [candidate division CSSED10-310 bacterium]
MGSWRANAMIAVISVLMLQPLTTHAVQREGVVINEVLYDPDGSDTGLEWVELHNSSPDPIELTGYDLKPDAGAYYTFPSVILAPGAWVVIHNNATGVDTETHLYAGLSSNMGNTAGS